MYPRFLALGLCFLVLTGCYLPAKFDARVEISQTGYYQIVFKGFLASVELYRGLKDRKINGAAEQERVALLIRDLKRDSAVKSVDYHGQGHFRIHYERRGDLLRAGQVTFLRRNEEILTLAYNRNTHAITVRGKYLRQQDAQRIRDMGLWMEGKIRLKTAVAVQHHNATTVRRDGARGVLLIWNVKSPFDPAPKATLTFR